MDCRPQRLYHRKSFLTCMLPLYRGHGADNNMGTHGEIIPHVCPIHFLKYRSKSVLSVITRIIMEQLQDRSLALTAKPLPSGLRVAVAYSFRSRE